jgi:hypothetical protein
MLGMIGGYSLGTLELDEHESKVVHVLIGCKFRMLLDDPLHVKQDCHWLVGKQMGD